MIVQVIFLILVMSLMKNSFSFNSLIVLLSLDYKKVLFTTLSTSYTDYQRFLLSKLLSFLGPPNSKKNSQLLGKFSILGKLPTEEKNIGQRKSKKQ